MTKLIIIRHGQSVANSKSVFAGHSDFPLTEFGKRQAEINARYVSENYKIDKVYASDLVRAFETGRAVAECAGVEIIPDESLREVYAGDWESMEFSEIREKYPEDFERWLTDIGNSFCTNGEVVADMYVRVEAALRRIAEENPGKTIAVATHATVIRIFQCYCEKKALSRMKDIPWVSNASVSVVNYENGEFTDAVFGYDEHLGDIRSTLPTNV